MLMASNFHWIQCRPSNRLSAFKYPRKSLPVPVPVHPLPPFIYNLLPFLLFIILIFHILSLQWFSVVFSTRAPERRVLMVHFILLAARFVFSLSLFCFYFGLYISNLHNFS